MRNDRHTNDAGQDEQRARTRLALAALLVRLVPRSHSVSNDGTWRDALDHDLRRTQCPTR